MRIDEAAVEEAVARRPFSGVASVHADGRRTWERVEGFAHRAGGVRMGVDTRIAIASGNKVFTALAVLRLVEDGALRLDQRVREVLGADLLLVDDAVTVEHLLGHTSGIGDYLDEDGDWEPSDHVLTVPVHTLTTAEAFLPVLEGHPQKWPPGERFGYCNQGYMVLALVLERVTGETYHDAVCRLVLELAGLTRTGFLPLDDLPADAAVGYVHDTGDLANTLRLPVLGNGDGGVFTTADDLHRFWLALLDGRIVTPETVALMTQARHDVPGEDKRYGLGLYVGDDDALIIEGYDAGASFRSTHLPATRTTVSVLGNSSEGAWPVIGVLASALQAG